MKNSTSKLNNSETTCLGAAIRTFVHSSASSLGGDTLFLSNSIPESQRSFIHGLFSKLEYNEPQKISGKNYTIAFFLCEAGSHKDEVGAQNPTRAIFFIKCHNNEIDCKSVVSECITGFSLTKTNHVRFVDSFFNDPEGLLQKPLVATRMETSSTLIKAGLIFILAILAFSFFQFRESKLQNPDAQVTIQEKSPEAETELLVREFISLLDPANLNNSDRNGLIKAFLSQFYLKSILDKMPYEASFWQQFREHKTDLLLMNMKSLLKPASEDLDRFLINEIEEIRSSDTDFNNAFFNALSAAFADKANFPRFENDELPQVKLKRFLDWFSYKGELSYVPDEEDGKKLQTVLLEEYDFIRSEKWRVFRQKSLR